MCVEFLFVIAWFDLIVCPGTLNKESRKLATKFIRQQIFCIPVIRTSFPLETVAKNYVNVYDIPWAASLLDCSESNHINNWH